MKLWPFRKDKPVKQRPRTSRDNHKGEANADSRGRPGFGRRAHRPETHAKPESSTGRKGPSLDSTKV